MPTKKIYTNTLAQIAGKLGTALISIILIKILTNYLDIAGYGLYSKIYNYLSIFSVIADLGLYTITVREIAEKRENIQQVEHILGNVLTLRTFMGVVIILVSLWISFFLPGYNSLMAQVGILITGFFTLFGLINSSIMSYLQATLQTEKSAIGNVGGKCITLFLIVLSAYYIFPLEKSSEMTRYIIVMLAGLAGNIWMTYYTYRYAAKLICIRFTFDLLYIKKIFKKSLPYGLALFLNVIFFKVDILLLSFLEDHSVADVSIALYSVPMKLVEVGMMYSTIFLNSLLPELTIALNSLGKNASNKEMNTPQINQTQELIKKGYKILFFFGLGVSGFLYSYPEEILTLISSSKYVHTISMGYSGLDAMHIVSWIFALFFLSSLATYIMIALGKEKRMIYINGSIALLNIIGNLLLIPSYSFYGSAIASLISQVCLLILTTWQVRELFPWKSLLPYSFSLLGLILTCSFIGTFLTVSLIWNLVIGFFIYGVVYMGGAFLINKYIL